MRTPAVVVSEPMGIRSLLVRGEERLEEREKGAQTRGIRAFTAERGLVH